uniref:Uncharacterized protein n=1 Tax=viral metagenome TaxID=1070528 RepID=A0A6M3M0B2_9ZZZZ
MALILSDINLLCKLVLIYGVFLVFNLGFIYFVIRLVFFAFLKKIDPKNAVEIPITFDWVKRERQAKRYAKSVEGLS